MNRSRLDWWRIGAMGAGVIWLFAGSAAGSEKEVMHRAFDDAIRQIGDGLARAALPDGAKNVAVLPLGNDYDVVSECEGGYGTDGLKSAVTGTRLKVFVRCDEEWKRLLEEIKLGIEKGDVMNPETIKKFGKFEGVDMILAGRVWDHPLDMRDTRGRARLSVHLAKVETGQVVWSSGPVEGTYVSDAAVATQYWRFLVVPACVVAGVITLVIVVRMIKRAARPL